MTPRSNTPDPVDIDAPLGAFSQCHAGILAQLEAMRGLSELVAAAERARAVAAASVALFKDGVLQHHGEEESELFPAVLRSALPGEEHDLVQTIVRRLTGEHRALEALWKRLEPAMTAAAKGRPADLDGAALAELVRSYGEHARFEEGQFLPLAATILGRNDNHMAALGMSLHMRHADVPVGYI